MRNKNGQLKPLGFRMTQVYKAMYNRIPSVYQKAGYIRNYLQARADRVFIDGEPIDSYLEELDKDIQAVRHVEMLLARKIGIDHHPEINVFPYL